MTLDMTHLPKDFLVERFRHPRAVHAVRNRHAGPSDPGGSGGALLVRGVLTDSYGRTSVRNLYAIGETAMTGLRRLSAGVQLAAGRGGVWVVARRMQSKKPARCSRRR